MSTWDIEQMTGYEPKTTFWEDFSIADRFGEEAVQDTYNRAFSEWKGNYVYLTELVLVLNHKIWRHYKAEGDTALTRIYARLWRDTDAYACDNLKGKEFEYFYRTVD